MTWYLQLLAMQGMGGKGQRRRAQRTTREIAIGSEGVLLWCTIYGGYQVSYYQRPGFPSFSSLCALDRL